MKLVFAQSSFGGTIEWLTSGIQSTASFLQDWLMSSFTIQAFAVIVALIVAVGIFWRIKSGRRL